MNIDTTYRASQPTHLGNKVGDANVQKSPNYAARRIAGVLGLGAVTAAVGLASVETINFFKDKVKENNLEEKIVKAGPNAVEQFNAGKFKGDDVVKLYVKKGEPTFTFSQEVTKDDKPVLATVDEVTAQTGDRVDNGEPVIVSGGLVEDSLKRPADLPDDPSTHVR